MNCNNKSCEHYSADPHCAQGSVLWLYCDKKDGGNVIDLKQEKLDNWQAKNFGRHDDDILKCALGMAEEVGEVCHHVLKGTQRIRDGVGGINSKEVADGVADTLIFGIQLMSRLGLDAEKEIADVIDKVLERDWEVNPTGEGM